MAQIETLRSLALGAGHVDLPLPMRSKASAGYDAAGTGTRARGWQPPRLGPSTLLLSSLDQIWARSHDAIRNNPWASAAAEKFESSVIGNGIQPHWQHPDESTRLVIQKAWARWSRQCDFNGQLDFYGMQSLGSRAIFEGGEIFTKLHVRPAKDRLFIPLQLQLIEGEQVPIWKNQISPTAPIRMGIEFDRDQRKTAYWMYRENPGETTFWPSDAIQFVRVPASEIIHTFKPLRIGQLRGQPRLTPVLALIYDLEKYTDAELLRKQVSAMFAGFITRPTPDGAFFPPAPGQSAASGTEQPLDSSSADPGVGIAVAQMEPGTMQELLPGEGITFPQVPDSPDFADFIAVQLHKFAAGLGMTYEQVSTDLRGVSYSSIRAGLIEFRRSCEQFQYHVMVQQWCEPIKNRWLREAVLCGAVSLPSDYFSDPSPYEDCVWVPPGWEWVDPLKESQASQLEVRAGFTSRTVVVRKKGHDPDTIDAQQASERARASKLGLIYDSDPNKVLIGKETVPTSPEEAKPTDESDEEDNTAFAHSLTKAKSQRKRRVKR